MTRKAPSSDYKSLFAEEESSAEEEEEVPEEPIASSEEEVESSEVEEEQVSATDSDQKEMVSSEEERREASATSEEEAVDEEKVEAEEEEEEEKVAEEEEVQIMGPASRKTSSSVFGGDVDEAALFGGKAGKDAPTEDDAVATVRGTTLLVVPLLAAPSCLPLASPRLPLVPFSSLLAPPLSSRPLPIGPAH